MSHELIFYKTPTGEQRIEVVYQDENFWMTGALDSDSILAKMEIVRPLRRVEAASCRFHNFQSTKRRDAASTL